MPLLALCGLASIIAGIAIFAEAKSAMHEITGVLFFVVFAICFASVLILGRLDVIKKIVSPEEDKVNDKKTTTK